MKKLTFALLALIYITVSSCGGSGGESSDDTATDSTATDETVGMTSLDLTPHGMDLVISIPDESFGKPLISQNEMGGVNIVVGDNFGISVLFGYGDIMMLKSDLENDLVYDAKIVVEDPNMLMYEKSIPESGLDPEYHFYYTTQINQETYDVQNMTSKTYGKAAIERMIVSAMSLTGTVAAM